MVTRTENEIRQAPIQIDTDMTCKTSLIVVPYITLQSSKILLRKSLKTIPLNYFIKQVRCTLLSVKIGKL